MFLQIIMKTARSLKRFVRALGNLRYLLRQASSGDVERRKDMEDQVKRLSKLR